MTVNVPIAQAASDRFVLPHPARLGAITGLLGLPLWMVCFVLLYSALPERPVGTPEQTIASYQSGGAAIWAFAIVSLLAIATMVAAIVILVRATGRPRRILGVLTVAATILGGLAFLVSWAGLLGMLTTDVAAPAAWVEMMVNDQVFDGIAYTSLAIAVTLLAFALRSAGLLRRAGLVLGIIDIVLTVVMVGSSFFVPVLPASLVFALGVGLLLRRQ